MKSALLFLLLAQMAFAQETAPAPTLPTPSVAPSPSLNLTKSGMIIDPKARANDFVQVFDLLRREKPTLKIMIRTASGMTLSNVTDVSFAQNGTLFIIKVLSNQGTKYQILPVEEMMEISYSP